MTIDGVASLIDAMGSEQVGELSDSDRDAIRADLPGWLQRWSNRDFVDQEFIAEVGMNVADRMPAGLDSTILAWLRGHREVGGLEPAAAFLSGYWRSSPTVDADTVTFIFREVDSPGISSEGRDCVYAALSAAVLSGSISGPLHEQIVARLRREAAERRKAGEVQGVYQVIRYV